MASIPTFIQDIINKATAAASASAPAMVSNANTPPKVYSPSMDEGSWWMFNQLRTTAEMDNLKLDPYNSFCNSYSSSNSTELNKQCGRLTEYNCKQVGCCVFTSNKTCEAGCATGATYSPNLDYYYYQNKCYGSKCPK
jgi:hypothetical protein